MVHSKTILYARSGSKVSSITNPEDLQRQLIAEEYDVGPKGADGVWGNNSQRALNQALADGYQYIDGKLIKPKNKPLRPKYTGSGRNPVVSAQHAVHDGKVIQECSKYGNCVLRDEGYVSNGDAWTRHNNQRTVYSGYDGLDRPETYDTKKVVNYNLVAADNVAKHFNENDLDKDRIYSVGMYYMGSPYQKTAYEKGVEGATNTHTGNLMYDKKLGTWVVKHNVHGTEYTNKLSDVLGSKGQYGVTGIYQPFKSNWMGRAASFVMGLF